MPDKMAGRQSLYFIGGARKVSYWYGDDVAHFSITADIVSAAAHEASLEPFIPRRDDREFGGIASQQKFSSYA